MASEVLSIPEQHLASFCDVLDQGLNVVPVPDDMAEGLREWIEEVREYLAESAE